MIIEKILKNMEIWDIEYFHIETDPVKVTRVKKTLDKYCYDDYKVIIYSPDWSERECWVQSFNIDSDPLSKEEFDAFLKAWVINKKIYKLASQSNKTPEIKKEISFLIEKVEQINSIFKWKYSL